MTTTTDKPVVENTTKTDDVHKFFNETDFRLDWSRRRQVVRYSLLLIGALYALAHIAVVLAFLFQVLMGGTIDPNIMYLLTTLIYTDSGAALSIIMSYVFGANLDQKDFRDKATTMFSNMFGRK